MYNFKKDEDGDYYVKEKLPNGQTLHMTFQVFNKNDSCSFWVGLIIYKKRKQLSDDRLYLKGTGTLGIKTLLIARDIILEFEEYMKQIIYESKTIYGRSFTYDKYYIAIDWDDNRRRDVYKRGLQKYGYDYGFETGFKCLRKRII